MYKNKHVCMLPKGAACEYKSPSAGRCRHLSCKARELSLPCGWHYASALYIRSRSSLLKEQHRQMREACWFTWHPYSPIRFYWDCFYLVINILVFILIPFQVFIHCPNPYQPLILFSDVVQFHAIIANAFTGRVDEDKKSVVLELKEIMKHYCRSRFLCDLIGALPLQVIELYANCSYPTHTIWYLLKLFRLLSVKQAWRNVFYQFGMSYMVLTTLSLVMKATMFFHWMTYIHYQTPALCYHLYPINHKTIRKWLKTFKVSPDVELSASYITNLYYVLGYCIGAGMYSPVNVNVIPELLLSSSLGIIGLLFVSYAFTGLLRLVVYKHLEKYLYNGRLKELQDYMNFKRLPLSLQNKVQLFINYKFNGHYFNEYSILDTINEHIKQEINMFCCKRLVMNVPLFQDMPVALINTIIFSLTQLLYMPGEVVVQCGRPGSSIYLIASGTVAVMNVAGKEVAHLKDGAFIGEKALITPGSLRSATIIALEITEIYKLTSKQFQACLQLCPRILRRLVARAARAPSLSSND